MKSIFLLVTLFLSSSLFAADHPTYGKEGAPIEIVVANDMECPFCERSLTKTLPALVQEFGDKIHFTIRQMPLSFHLLNEKASVAALCATEQDVFWPFFKFFTKEQSGNRIQRSAEKTAESEKSFSLSQFQKCLADVKVLERVRSEKAEMENAGASGTPTFWVNGKKVMGNNLAELKEVIGSLIKTASK